MKRKLISVILMGIGCLSFLSLAPFVWAMEPESHKTASSDSLINSLFTPAEQKKMKEELIVVYNTLNPEHKNRLLEAIKEDDEYTFLFIARNRVIGVRSLSNSYDFWELMGSVCHEIKDPEIKHAMSNYIGTKIGG